MEQKPESVEMVIRRKVFSSVNQQSNFCLDEEKIIYSEVNCFELKNDTFSEKTSLFQ